jgi:gamma-glutamylcyclotransferase (GGCT)/AIG2-like uncharacterized protein YtfP
VVAPSLEMRCVFVYGTLRRGEQRDINLLSPAPSYLGEGRVRGVLYHLGAYPGVLLGGGGAMAVHGEVYQISSALERLLDQIEEVWPEASGEYFKREVPVQLDGSASGDAGRIQLDEIQCLVYELSASHARGRPVIASGDWKRRL